MVKNKEYLEAFENQLAADEKVDFLKNLEIYEAMWQHAVELGLFPLKNPYEGMEDDIRLARILNHEPSVPVTT